MCVRVCVCVCVCVCRHPVRRELNSGHHSSATGHLHLSHSTTALPRTTGTPPLHSGNHSSATGHRHLSQSTTALPRTPPLHPGNHSPTQDPTALPQDTTTTLKTAQLCHGTSRTGICLLPAAAVMLHSKLASMSGCSCDYSRSSADSELLASLQTKVKELRADGKGSGINVLR